MGNFHISAACRRYYDEIGLPPPAHTDPFTGYRYYTADQLTRLNRILAFKELGLSLEQIRGMLRLKPVAPQTILSARVVAPSVDFLKTWFNESFGHIYAFIGQNNLKDGACMAIYHDDVEIGYHTEDIDSEAAVVVAAGDVSAKLPEGVHSRTLEGAEMASIIHKGAFDTINATCTDVVKWIAANGYRVIGPFRSTLRRMSIQRRISPKSSTRLSWHQPLRARNFE